MKRILIAPVATLLAVGMFLLLLSCGASHRLHEYDFTDLRAAAVISAPQPEVFTSFLLAVDTENLVLAALRMGATIAKEVTAEETQSRLDSAMVQVNVPELIRHRVLQRGSQCLRLRPSDDVEGCDCLFDLYVHHYGIDAQTWDSGVYFEMKMDVALIDNRTGQLIWKTSVKEHQPISRSFFFPGGQAASDVITAIALSQVTTEEMAIGFQHLAEDVADDVVRCLRRDRFESR